MARMAYAQVLITDDRDEDGLIAYTLGSLHVLHADPKGRLRISDESVERIARRIVELLKAAPAPDE